MSTEIEQLNTRLIERTNAFEKKEINQLNKIRQLETELAKAVKERDELKQKLCKISLPNIQNPKKQLAIFPRCG
jgi:predicted RNase H-like nuclease (RuvC/YqgF family)